MIEFRIRNQVTDAELENKIGKIITPNDFNVVLTGPARVLRPDGSLLAVYVPGALRSSPSLSCAYPALHSLKGYVSDNRGDASGTQRVRREGDKRTRSRRVASAMIGNFGPMGPKKYCRHSSWTISHPDEWAQIVPLLVDMGKVFREYVPDRWAVQMKHVQRTQPEWVIPGTPYTSITVNNTYPTGVHRDSGDLDEGFSCLSVLRRGQFGGGILAFPRYRLGVDMGHGDVLLMQAHEFHGNTMIQAERLPQDNPRQAVQYKDAERVSVVAYYRTDMAGCGTEAQELDKAEAYHGAGGNHR